MEWLFFALLAPLFYATSNVIDKHALEQRTLGLADYMFFASLGSVSLALFFFMTGEAITLSIDTAWPAVLSGILMNGSYLLFALALSRTESYKLTPFFLLIPIVLVVVDAVFYDAIFTYFHWLALVLSLFGSYILSRPSNSGSLFKLDFASSSITMLISVLLLAAGIFLMDKLSDPGQTNQFVMLQCFGFSLATLLYFIRKEWRREIAEGLRSVSSGKVVTFALNDAADLLGNWLFVAAVALAPSAGYVSLALGIQPFYVFAIVYIAYKINPTILNENLRLDQGLKITLGAGLLIGGLLLLALAP
tara:strand:+ start:1268 stop:2182 length:915 start_codon:yes stop_codon:yes gene_type:complete